MPTCWRSSAPNCWRHRIPTAQLPCGPAPAAGRWCPATQWIACSAGEDAKAAACTTGPASSSHRRPPARWAGGCWCAAAAAASHCYGPAATPLVGLVGWPEPGGRWRRASNRKGEVGLDHYEVRRWRAGIVTSPWPCWPMLSWPSPALRLPTRAREGGIRSLAGGLGLLPLTVLEVRRLLVALVWTTPVTPGFVLAWSRWRRRHQARARRAHYHRREQQLRLAN